MPVRLIDPRDEAVRTRAAAAARLDTLEGRRLALVDISKPGGSVFLDRLAHHLQRDYGVATIARLVKPAFSKLSPAALLDQLRDAEAVVLALAD